MSEIDDTQRDLEGLVEAGYLETWIDPETKEQQFRMTEFGQYEMAAGTAVNQSPRLARKYTHEDTESALDRLVHVAKRSVKGENPGDRESFEWDDDQLREWIRLKLEPHGEPTTLLEDDADG